jgi:serine/threonine protein kinase
MNRYRVQLILLAAGLMMVCHMGMGDGEISPLELSFEAQPPLVVDALWQQGILIWTHRQGFISAYLKREISQIRPLAALPKRVGFARLTTSFWQWRWQAFVLINTHKPLGRDWPPRHLDLLLTVFGGGILLALLVSLRGSVRRQGAVRIEVSAMAERGGGKSHGSGETPGNLADASVASDSERQDGSLQELVVSFFLQLYGAQCAPGRQPQVRYSASSASGPHGTTIFELQVKDRAKIHRRRMSIGPLGPVGEGHSNCFIVIFDVHLVVKLPRSPITDYGHYIDSMDREREIAARLKGVPVIAPRVTTILEKVHRFGDHDSLSPDEVEGRYIAWMRRNPAFQRYLKVGDSFAFFMELSSHRFLHHVYGDLHLNEARIRGEIRDHGHLIWKPHEFIGRYGAAAQPVCAQLQGIYTNCRRSLDLPGREPVLTDYQHKKAFLEALSAHVHKPGTASSSDEASLHMHGLVGAQEAVLRHYRRTLVGYLQKTLFMRHRQQIGALVANTLYLTSWLHGRRIALRDLKPDNLLVVGESGDFPDFLKRREGFRLGLIDLETATAYQGQGEGGGLLSPPKPGGTPLYATPSHFVSFELLATIYPDPFEVLLEQDWYAAIAICFRTVTGEHLWDGTAGLFSALVETLASIDPGEAEVFAQLFSKLSCVFWSNARMEFRDKLHQHRTRLGKVKVDLSPRCVETLTKRIDRRLDLLQDEVRSLLGAHEELEVVTRHLRLADATSEQIRLLRNTWEMEATTGSKEAHLVSDRFRQLEGLSQTIEALEEGRGLLENWDTGVELLPLLAVLFAHCLGVMYRWDWQELGHRRIDWHEALMDTSSYTQTL